MSESTESRFTDIATWYATPNASNSLTKTRFASKTLLVAMRIKPQALNEFSHSIQSLSL